MNTEPFAVLRNYAWLVTMNAEPLDVLRNGKYVVGRQHFVDTALRRRAFRRYNFSSTGHFIDRIRGSTDDYNRIILVL
jgi:hypothetical protein